MPLGDFEARTAYHLRQAFVKEIKSSRERCRSKMEKKILQMLATIIAPFQFKCDCFRISDLVF